MHELLPYGKRAYYPNLREGETALWERFLRLYPEAYENVIYNLHIGEGAPIPEDTPESIARDFKLLTQYKIDVVGLNPGSVDIIELKPYAGASAIGQLLSYRILYVREFSPPAVPKLLLVTDHARQDTKTLVEEAGITLIVV